MNITIVGGGFGGVKAALELAKNKKNTITLISDKPDFQYYPALYGTATGHSERGSWIPLGEIFAEKQNVTVCLDRIKKIDVTKKVLTGESGMIYEYKKCIMALGSVTTYFGIDGLDAYSYGIKSAEEIKRLKRHIYEDIVGNHVVSRHYVVIGGGPTGVELASELGSYVHKLCAHYSKTKSRVYIDLIEAAPRLLPKMHPKVSEHVEKRLESLGVKVQTGKAVESETADEIMVSGHPLKSQTVIWTSGVAVPSFYKENESQFTFAAHGGRVAVDQHLRAGKDLYVIGDNAATPFTGLAQTALYDAIFVAKNLEREARGKRQKEYKAVMPPIVVPVGEWWAVLEWRKIRFYSWIGWLFRLAADIRGYHDVLPLGKALSWWYSNMTKEEDFFAPVPKRKK